MKSPALAACRRSLASLLMFPVTLLLTGCGDGERSEPAESHHQGLASAPVPLIDFPAGGTYLGFTGGLYPQGSNTLPSAHAAAGSTAAAAIRPLDVNGNPSANGRYVLLSIGMSHTTQEFCSQTGAEPCDAWTFMGKAAADPAVNKSTLVIANGAKGGQSAPFWDSPTDANYDRVRDSVLAPKGLSEKHVQVLWVKLANASPTVSLPASNADAYQLEASIGNVLRAAKARYPNLKQAFLTSRSYGGYANTSLNPEPYAYESGFAVKWLIEAQIRQKQNGVIDTQSGDLDYGKGVAPWVAWGPYPWADGLNPRSDGLIWERADFVSDGTHPSQSGEDKVSTMLLDFFKSSPQTRCWFLGGLTCP